MGRHQDHTGKASGISTTVPIAVLRLVEYVKRIIPKTEIQPYYQNMPFNPSSVIDCQVFAGLQRAVEVNFTDGTSHIFDGTEITDELWAFAATKPPKKLTLTFDLRRTFSKN